MKAYLTIEEAISAYDNVWPVIGQRLFQWMK